MVKGELVMALDYRRDNRAIIATCSYRENEKWFVAKSGPGYCNVWKITEYDDEGLDWLKSIERKE